MVTELTHTVGPYYIIVDEDGMYYTGKWSRKGKRIIQDMLYDTEKGAKMAICHLRYEHSLLRILKVTFDSVEVEKVWSEDDGRAEESGSAAGK